MPPMLRVPAQTKRKQLEKAEPGQDPSYFTLITTLPFERPVSMYVRASWAASKGKTRSMTGRMIPDSMRDVIWLNCSPFALMKRNE